MSHSRERENRWGHRHRLRRLVTAVGFAELGNDVSCIDIDEAKIECLKAGRMPDLRARPGELVARHRGRLHFSTASRTRSKRSAAVRRRRHAAASSGDADLSPCTPRRGDAASDRALVMKSTVPVGTGATVKRLFATRARASPTSPAPNS